MDYLDETCWNDDVIDIAERSPITTEKRSKKTKKKLHRKRRSSHSPTRKRKRSHAKDGEEDFMNLSSSKSWYGPIGSSPSTSAASSRRSSAKLLWPIGLFETFFRRKSSSNVSYELVEKARQNCSSLHPKWKSANHVEKGLKSDNLISGSDIAIYTKLEPTGKKLGVAADFYISTDEDFTEPKGEIHQDTNYTITY